MYSIFIFRWYNRQNNPAKEEEELRRSSGSCATLPPPAKDASCAAAAEDSPAFQLRSAAAESTFRKHFHSFNFQTNESAEVQPK